MVANNNDNDGISDVVDLSSAVNSLLLRTFRLLKMSETGVPKRMLAMETAMVSESASRVSVILARAPEVLTDHIVTNVYNVQFNYIKGGE
jgi:hypothetical protein